MEDKLPGFEGTNQAPAPDAWLGVFKSIDGGSTWKSTLLPGFYYFDTTPAGAPASPLYGFSAAADPVVRAGPNGLYFFAGIVFNREDRGDSAVFVSRFIDNNNKENVDTTAYIDTQIQVRGSSGQFIDKPWLAVDVPYQEAPSIPINLPDPDIDTQYVTRCNVYLAYSVFLGNPDLNIRTKVYFARSTDSGMTWQKPTKLTETQHISQGAVIAVDPRGNGHVWVAWRRFAHINNIGQIIQPDAIVVVKSEDGGATFTKPHVVAELVPWFPPSDEGVFDQPTTAVSFRTNDYPTMAVDHNGTAYIAWTQRGLGPTPIVGEARIVMTASSDGVNWSTPAQAICDDEPIIPDPPGHQLMPQLTYAAEKLTLLWYDHRWDVIQIFLPFIEDIYQNVRHTIDVRVAQAEISSYPVFSPSIQVSKYPFLLYNDDELNIFMAYQLFYNRPNLPLFSLGTRPFMGDYIGIAPSPKFLSPEDPNNPTDYWIYNTNSSVPTIYHAVWTDNRDVVHPDETPLLPGDTPDYGEWDGYNTPGVGCANGKRTGIRNQNIYTSRISEGILAGSPGNTKPLNILRSFAVFVQNMTGVERTFDLEIIKPSELEAYFWQEGGDPTGILKDVFVPPYSYVSKTILVEAYSSEYASIIINISDAESGELVDYVTLNPDSTNPIIDEPEDMAAGNPHPRNEGETHTPHPRNYTIIDWNTEQYDPYINTIIPQYDEAVANNDGITPYPVEGDVDNPHGRNPHGRNPNPLNPHGRNFLLNPHPRNEHIEAIEDGSQMTDVVWTIENAGNTTTSYSINTFETPQDLPEGVLAQIIVFKTYTTPAVDIWDTQGCQLIEQEHQEMVVNLTTPHPRNPGDPTPHPRNLGELGDVSVNVPPNGVFHVLYRYYNPYQSDEQKEFHDEGKYEEAVPDIESDTPDTDHDIIVGPPPKLLVIPPQALPDAVVGDTSYSTTLQVVGGTGTYGNWTVIDEYLPTGLSLNPDTGVISSNPSPATAGTYTFKVQVNDFDEGDASKTNPLQTATKILSISVVDPLEITTISLPDAVVGVPYSETLQAIGGTIPYTWSVFSGTLPPGWSLNLGTGEISGTPTVPGDSFFTIRLADSSSPQQFDNKPFSIRVVNPLVITTDVLYDAFKGGGYVDILDATGGTETYTWSIISGSPPAGLALTPVTNIIEGTVDQAATDSTFTVQVTDSGSPVLFDTKVLTIYVYDLPQITTSSPLPNGTVGASYSQILIGSEGNTPYTWNVFSGTLPPGLSLNSSSGEISGTPTTEGAYSFQIHMTDSSNPNQTPFMNFSITITIPTLGLVAYYPFNGNANDESGNANHGTINGGATFTEDRFGNTNSALNFDGTDDYVELPNETSFDLTELTIVAVFKVPDYLRRNYMIGKGPYFGNFNLMINGPQDANTGRAGYAHQIQSGNWSSKVTNDPIPQNQFLHVAVTLDATTFRSYLNGQPEWTALSPTPPVLNDENVVIGAFGYLGVINEFFLGVIDDIRIYNRVLSETEIEELYMQEIGGLRNDMGAYGGPYINIDYSSAVNIINVPGNHATIQQAINAALPGDTVIVAPGTYNENVHMKDGVDLLGSGAEVTTIDAQGYGDVVNACVNNATISGFTLRNSGESDLGHYNCGVYIDGNYAPIVRNNVIVGNNNGIGIWYGANPDIRNNIIKDNFDGFYVYGDDARPCNPSIINNTIVDNERSGIVLRVKVSPTILNNIITGHVGGWTSGDQFFPNSSGINFNGVTGSPVLDYNDVWNNDVNYVGTSAGTHDISADPKFINPANGDYHLLLSSPCIDTGDPNPIYNDVI